VLSSENQKRLKISSDTDQVRLPVQIKEALGFHRIFSRIEISEVNFVRKAQL